MKILVTGGAGFIGSNLVDRYLTEGHQVAIVDNLATGRRGNINSQASFHEVSITDEDALRGVFEAERPEVVNHHAAQMDVRRSVREPQFDAQTNIIGTLNVIEAARALGARKLIFSSSGGAIYGEADIIPTPETAPLQPISHYGASKLAAEVYFALYGRLFRMEYTVLRYANVYGPRQNPHGEAGVNAIFANMMLRGERPTIFGAGDKTRDYVFVGDVVRRTCWRSSAAPARCSTSARACRPPTRRSTTRSRRRWASTRRRSMARSARATCGTRAWTPRAHSRSWAGRRRSSSARASAARSSTSASTKWGRTALFKPVPWPGHSCPGAVLRVHGVYDGRGTHRTQ